jgi:SAM-dependent methyltransferase
MAPGVQRSQVLRAFLDTLANGERPEILDLGPVRGDNIQFFCDLGFKVHAFDLWDALPVGVAEAGESGEGPLEEKLYWKVEEDFHFPDGSLAGVLCWDILDHMEFKSAYSLIQRIKRSMREGGLLLSFFNMRRMNGTPMGRGYRILDREHVELVPGDTRPAARHVHQNGDIMKLFAGFKILYFYFLRNNLRELLVQKPVPQGR